MIPVFKSYVYSRDQVRSPGSKRLRAEIKVIWAASFPHIDDQTIERAFECEAYSHVAVVRVLPNGPAAGIAMAYTEGLNQWEDAWRVYEDYIYVSKLAVLPEYRGRGVAGMLLDAIYENLARGKLIHVRPGEDRSIVLDVDDGEDDDSARMTRIYARYGFREITGADRERLAYTSASHQGDGYDTIRLIR